MSSTTVADAQVDRHLIQMALNGEMPDNEVGRLFTRNVQNAFKMVRDAATVAPCIDYDRLRQLIPPKVLADACIEEVRKISRTQAATNRAAVMARAEDKCEACFFPCFAIAHIHHIYPVSRGGTGIPENLIVLCPNCHVCIHRMRERWRTGDDEALRRIRAWAEDAHGVSTALFLYAVARSDVHFDNDAESWRFARD